LPVNVLNAGISPKKFEKRMKKKSVRKKGNHFSPNSFPNAGYTIESRTKKTKGSSILAVFPGIILFLENAGIKTIKRIVVTISIIRICWVNGILIVPELIAARCIGFKKGSGCHSLASVMCFIRVEAISGDSFCCSPLKQ